MANLVITLQTSAKLMPLFFRKPVFAHFPPTFPHGMHNADERNTPAGIYVSASPANS